MTLVKTYYTMIILRLAWLWFWLKIKRCWHYSKKLTIAIVLVTGPFVVGGICLLITIAIMGAIFGAMMRRRR